jgi:hypothetical protein
VADPVVAQFQSFRHFHSDLWRMDEMIASFNASVVKIYSVKYTYVA